MEMGSDSLMAQIGVTSLMNLTRRTRIGTVSKRVNQPMPAAHPVIAALR
jgi:hypothetical protein